MCVPLRDQKGALRYYLGAQLDITPLIEICLEFSTLRDLIWREESRLGLSSEGKSTTPDTPIRDEFENLMESFDKAELQRLLEFERKKDLLPEGVFPNESADEEGRLSPEQWTELPDVHNTGQRPSKSINVYPNVRRNSMVAGYWLTSLVSSRPTPPISPSSLHISKSTKGRNFAEAPFEPY